MDGFQDEPISLLPLFTCSQRLTAQFGRFTYVINVMKLSRNSLGSDMMKKMPIFKFCGVGTIFF